MKAEPCSQGEMLFYGGNNRRIRKLGDCTVQNVGNLPFNFKNGACTATNDQLFLCFDQSGSGVKPLKTCRISNEPTDSFEMASRSNFDHGTIQIASSESKSRLSYSCFCCFLSKITGQSQHKILVRAFYAPCF